ncbi:alginate O-acetyltransferase AlgX-related protein [Roseicyclus marinus]|uniref:alginate O-acetyltransferase AlgX-related protein n=1 Tax=Roseicyclus marinus TaxID=2161673 RepID=UPI00240F29B3|nr:hypothetical protein [Roseicyclus marinus]MDG3042774.1 hypothetical protein [Roseicyclus marinus]
MTKRARMGPIFASALLATLPSHAVAQEVPSGSAFGCSMLDSLEPVPVIEGLDGMFFRLTDLRMNHPLSDRSIDLMVAFSNALAERGTTLIYVPVPTKGLVMPDLLPPEAAAYGFDFEIATMMYLHFVDRLRSAGIETVDIQTPLLEVGEPDYPFLRTDFHWSPSGARAAAVAVAEVIRARPGYNDLTPVPHVTASIGPREIASAFRRSVQARCRDHIPRAVTEAFETQPVDGGLSIGAGIFAAEARRPGIMLVGTSMSQTSEFNFDGFLAEAAQLDLTNYAVTGGNQFGAMLGYMMSGDFASNPPHFLVWENPIYNNLGEFGGLAVREIIVAAVNDCVPLTTVTTEAGVLVAEGPSISLSEGHFLRADVGASGAYSAEFSIVTANGIAQNAIDRTRRGDPTPLFYLDAGHFGQVDRIEVRFGRPIGASASVSLCSDGGTSAS